MAIIENRLGYRVTLNSFFGPVYLDPGLNSDIPDRLWRNLKTKSPDVQAYLKQELLVEHEPSAA